MEQPISPVANEPSSPANEPGSPRDWADWLSDKAASVGGSPLAVPLPRLPTEWQQWQPRLPSAADLRRWLPAAAALLLLALLLCRSRSAACTFSQAAPGLWLCVQGGQQPALVRVHKSEGWLPWRRRQTDHWVLVGAGAPDTLLWGGHASGLAKGVHRAVARGAPPAQLDLIVLTDAHSGALPKLLQRYPEALVAAHENARPYLLANASESQAGSRAGGAQGLLPELGPGGVPPDRLLDLQSASGDLADAAAAAGGRAKKALRWLPRGLLRFRLVGSPTPGSIALLHTPSGALLVGRAVAPKNRWLGGGQLAVGRAAYPAALVEQEVAVKRLIMQGDFDWLLPGAGGGNFSRRDAQRWVADWPQEAPAPHEGASAGGASLGQGLADTAAAGLGLSPGGGANSPGDQPGSDAAAAGGAGPGGSAA